MKLCFSINFRTKVGEVLQILVKQEGYEDKIHLLSYADNGEWKTEIDHYSKTIEYIYQLINEERIILDQEISAHYLNFPHNIKEFHIFDVWNLKNFPENYLNNKVLENKWQHFKSEKVSPLKKHTHLFRIEAPLYNCNWRIVILGEAKELGNWEYQKALPMLQTALGVWEIALSITTQKFIQYKYGILNSISGEVFDLESGNNRYSLPNVDENSLHIKADHFFRYKAFEMYHAAGVAVPIFSLRSEQSFGVGEFRDLKSLADWSSKTDLNIIQILPINDTTTNYSWTDSYPYSAISVYALHPQYLAVDALDFPIPKENLEEYKATKILLNSHKSIDFEPMIAAKWTIIKAIFNEHETKILADKNFKKFIKNNESWLLPYSAFCVQRDRYRTADFSLWKTHKKYIAGKIAPFFSPKNKNFKISMLHAWVQYQLHIQLNDAVNYIHSLGISLKGDLPIGIYRYSVEAWIEPELFDMDFQAGAPPDQFSDLGQNWGFPTYNWKTMKKNDYLWWKNRFKALEQYFDAMRIDHILGFFRIWRMPNSAVQGILGYFHPAIPVTLEEFKSKQISFNKDRFCKPFINDKILWDYFGEEVAEIQHKFLNAHNGHYSFKEDFDTQRKLQHYFYENPDHVVEEKVIALSANVLFLIENKDGVDVYHPRFNLHKTSSYQFLSDFEKHQLYDIYIDYFYKRQDDAWYKNAMEKLPVILNATKMLMCGEDLGLVPECVPQVMDRLGITALKVQRMPLGDIPYYDPKDATYLNVVTASSHDTSTLRQWWMEDRDLIQQYFSEQLKQWGTAPHEMEPLIGEFIMKQHLHNDAMLAIFPIQEFLATDHELRNPDRDLERINNPAVFPHNWKYRMHLTLEVLNKEENFNNKIADWIKDSGRF